MKIVKDYKERILQRAKIANVELNSNELEELNDEVNYKTSYGLHEYDALDAIYFKLNHKYELIENY